MALNTSRLNLQGVGVVTSAPVIIEGSNPAPSFNVSVSTSNYGNWTTDGLLLQNVTTLPASSTFTITPEPGYQINSGMFTNDNIPNSSYYTSIEFSNTVSAIDTSNEVEVTINWISQSVTEDISILLSNIGAESIPEGVLNYGAAMIINHEDATVTVTSNLNTVSTQPLGVDSTAVGLSGVIPVGDPVLIATITAVTDGTTATAYSIPPVVNFGSLPISGNSNFYSVQTTVTAMSAITEVYFTPPINAIGSGFEEINLSFYQSEIGAQFYNPNSSTLSEITQLTVENEDEDNNLTYQEVTVGLSATLTSITDINFYEDIAGSVVASWITNISYNASTSLLTFRVNDNAGAERQAYIAVYSNSTLLAVLTLTQTPFTFLSLNIQPNSVVDYNNNVVSSSPTSINNGPVVGFNFTLEATLESFTDASDHISNLGATITQTQLSIDGGIVGTSFINVGNPITIGSTILYNCTVYPNVDFGLGVREATISIQHPIDASLVEEVTIGQGAAYNPAVDTIELLDASSTAFTVDNTVPVNPYNGQQGYYADANQVISALSATGDATTFLIQVVYSGQNPISEPIIEITYQDANFQTQYVTNSTGIYVQNPNFSEWLDIDYYVVNSNPNYQHTALIAINVHGNTANFERNAIINIYHPNALSESVSGAIVGATIAVEQEATNVAYFDSFETLEHIVGLNSLSTATSYAQPMFSTQSQAPVVILEAMIEYDYDPALGVPIPSTTNPEALITFYNDSNGSTDGNTDDNMTSFSISGTAGGGGGSTVYTYDNTATLDLSFTPNTEQTPESGVVRYKSYIFRAFPAGTSNISFTPGTNLSTPGEYSTPYLSTFVFVLNAVSWETVFGATKFMVSTGATVDTSLYAAAGSYQASSYNSGLVSYNDAVNNNPAELNWFPIGPFIGGDLAANQFNLNPGTSVGDISRSQSSFYFGFDVFPTNQTITATLVSKAYLNATNNSHVIAFTPPQASDSVISSITLETASNLTSDFNHYIHVVKESYNTFQHDFGSGNEDVTIVSYQIRIDIDGTSEHIVINMYTEPKVPTNVTINTPDL